MVSNLPPGITENMLPGNRPEDEAWDNLHIEIDNDADSKGFGPWDALEIWHMGIEQWQKRTEHGVAEDGEGCTVDNKLKVHPDYIVDPGDFY